VRTKALASFLIYLIIFVRIFSTFHFSLIFHFRSYQNLSPYTHVLGETECPLTILDMYRWSIQIAKGLEYLISKKVTHLMCSGVPQF